MNTKTNPNAERSHVFAVGLGLVTFVLVLLLVALKLYLNNLRDFSFSFATFFLSFATLVAIGALLLMASTFFLQKTIFPKALLTGLLFFVLLAWIQSHIFPWTHGSLQGHSIPWDDYAQQAKGEYLAIFIILSASIFLVRKHPRLVPKVLTVLAFTQIAELALLAAKHPEKIFRQNLSFDSAAKYNFSRQKNVIVLILDAFQGSVFDRLRAHTDLMQNFGGFTWYKNASASIPSTTVSLPFIFSGIAYDNSRTVEDYQKAVLRDHSFAAKLKDAHYKTEFYTVYEGIIPADDTVWSNAKIAINSTALVGVYSNFIQTLIFTSSPQFIKRTLYSQGNWTYNELVQRALLKLFSASSFRSPMTISEDFSQKGTNCCASIPPGFSYDVDFTNQILNRMRKDEDQKVLKIFHMKGMHVPRNINEDLRIDPNLNDRLSSLDTVGLGSLKLVSLFLQKLKANSLYDSSDIIIVSDHGSAQSVQISKSPHNQALNHASLFQSFDAFKGMAMPLVLVKAAHMQGPLSVSEKPVTLGDIPQTILDMNEQSAKLSEYSLIRPIPDDRERLTWSHAYYDNKLDYYSDLQEFKIQGNIYDDSAWTTTGRILKPQKSAEDVVEQSRKDHIKSLSPLEEISLLGKPYANPPFGDWSNSFNVKKAFDRRIGSSGWLPLETEDGACAKTAKIGLRFESPFALKAYSLRTRVDITSFAPKSWILRGTNDEQRWIDLHAIHDDRSWEDGGKPRDFKVENTKEFKQYEIEILESQNGKCISLEEVELYR